MEYTKFKPLGTRVLVKEDTPQEKTAGGIIIPDTAKEMPTTGTVFLVGNKCEYVKPGDRVMYPKGGGARIQIDGVDYLKIFEETIEAIL